MHLKLEHDPHMHYTRARLDASNRPIAENVKGLDGHPMRVARDTYSGHYYVQIAKHMPSADTPSAKSLREAIEKQKPLHYSSERPGMTGYWVRVDHAQIPLSETDRAKAHTALGSSENSAAPVPEEVADYSGFALPGASAITAETPLQEVKE